MIPMEGDTDFRSSNSSGERLPGFKWGSRPVSSNTLFAATLRYSVVVL